MISSDSHSFSEE